MASLIGNWWVFTKERFSLPAHVPMVALFSLGNLAMTAKLASADVSFSRYLILFLLAFSFFFRLRCFDEIKDYEVDLQVNPTRPLARGVLSIAEVKAMIGALSVFEVALATYAGVAPLVLHLIAMAYSFFMYKEFFIGKYLRPHLTTYAVTHTFVSMLLGWSLAAQTLRQFDLHTFQALLWMGPINWALFNLFEFARKTYALEEERPTVESYSSIFGIWGATLLSLSQITCALLVIYLSPMPGLVWQLVAALFPVFAGLLFCLRRSKASASLFRNVTGAYLLLFYLVLSYQGLYL